VLPKPSFPLPSASREATAADPNAASPTAVALPVGGVLPEPSPDAITVLVVDDERSNVESLEKIFVREGMRVLSAVDAKRALELVRSHRVHVVLSDLMMPGTTGLELLRAIRQVAPDVEVVLMTAYGSVEVAVTAMRDGAYDFVEKPLKRISIVKSVRKAAENSASSPRTSR
jgi:two-component system response regulator HydG